MLDFRVIVVAATWVPAVFMCACGDFAGAWSWLWRAVVVRLVVLGICAEIENFVQRVFKNSDF